MMGRARSWALAAQVRHALLCDDDLHGMLAVVHVADQRNDGGDLAALGVEGQLNIERYALRAKSPEPPMPFIICGP